MLELWLNFKDENGEPKRILVERKSFSIGRTPENDLGIPLGNISRQHAKIERFDDTFEVSDCGSSNGTTLNGEDVFYPSVLKNGDLINLGGGLEIKVEIVSARESANKSNEKLNNGSIEGNQEINSATRDEPSSNNAVASSNVSNASANTSSSSMPSAIFFIIPVVMVLFLLIIGGLVIFLSHKDDVDITKKDNSFTYSTKDNSNDDDDTPKHPKKSETPAPDANSSPSPASTTTSPANSTTPDSTSTPDPTGNSTQDTPSQNVVSDTDKAKTASASFLRRIATKDPNAFLTTAQVNIINDKIKAFKGSSVLADNLKDAKKNSAKIQQLAATKNLKPQFLAIAAVAELGNQRGDVAAKATEIAGVLADLTQVLSDELADDRLLVIAAYDQGKAGRNNEMRDMLTKTSNEFPNTSVRSVWFLHDKGKISPDEFDRVLRFLAVGTISQSPKDFNVSADALVF